MAETEGRSLEGAKEVNWRRGFFRLWVVAALGWAILWLVIAYFGADRGNVGGFLVAGAVMAFIPPLVLLAVGAALAWALRSFHS
jgi:hypothetical protein